MKIIKRNGEEIVFDISKIVEAISKALDLLAGVAEAITEIVEDFERNFSSTLHSLAHWMLHCFASAGRKIRKVLHISANGTTCLVFVISACVKILNQVADVVSCKTRSTYLLRTQDRGSSDSESVIRIAMMAA